MLNVAFHNRWKGDSVYLKVIREMKQDAKATRAIWARMFKLPFESTANNWGEYEKWEIEEAESMKMKLILDSTVTELQRMDPFYRELKKQLEAKNEESFV